MTVSRRGLLAGFGGLAVLGAAGSLGLISPGPAGQTGALLRSAGPLPRPFTADMPLPPEAKPVRPGVYELTARPAEIDVLPGRRTRILGYDGVFPGPTIRARRDEPVTVKLRNETGVPTVLHLHGGRTPPGDDGYPTDLVLPVDGMQHTGHSGHSMTMPGRISHGGRDYRFPLEQRAATLWYHDHAMDFTGPNVYLGLAGFFLLADAEESALPLPDGDRELPLMICDRAFGPDGEFRYPALAADRSTPGVTEQYMGGVLGDVVLVNGAPWPRHEVSTTRYRLRILNASNARRYELSLRSSSHGPIPFTQIGTDGGLLGAPVQRRSITLATAERVDVLVDFGRLPVGETVRLVNELGDGGTAQVMRFDVVHAGRDDSEVPRHLGTVERLDRAQVTEVRDIAFRVGRPGDGHLRWTINDRTFDPDFSVAEPRLGATELWRFSTEVHHPVHLHLAPMQVLSRNGKKPGVADAGWKDTVDLLPGQTCEALVRFDGYRGRYVFHCHNLEHEDMAMMANFTVR